MRRFREKPRRTQIYLSPWQESVISSIAAKDRLTKSSVIRRYLGIGLKRAGHKEMSAVEFFKWLSRGTDRMDIPSDLSERVDYYLYGKGSKKFR